MVIRTNRCTGNAQDRCAHVHMQMQLLRALFHPQLHGCSNHPSRVSRRTVKTGGYTRFLMPHFYNNYAKRQIPEGGSACYQ